MTVRTAKARPTAGDRGSDAVSAGDWRRLEQAARRARRHAYAPWSEFPVGAAVLAADGRIFAGCNVENATFGLTVCAERGAVIAAVATGAARATAVKRLRACVVIADHRPPARPCGPCLQTLAEFGSPDLPIRLIATAGGRDDVRLADLLPQPFGGDFKRRAG